MELQHFPGSLMSKLKRLSKLKVSCAYVFFSFAERALAQRSYGDDYSSSGGDGSLFIASFFIIVLGFVLLVIGKYVGGLKDFYDDPSDQIIVGAIILAVAASIFGFIRYLLGIEIAIFIVAGYFVYKLLPPLMETLANKKTVDQPVGAPKSITQRKPAGSQVEAEHPNNTTVERVDFPKNPSANHQSLNENIRHDEIAHRQQKSSLPSVNPGDAFVLPPSAQALVDKQRKIYDEGKWRKNSRTQTSIDASENRSVNVSTAEAGLRCRTCGHVFQSTWLSPRCPICDQTERERIGVATDLSTGVVSPKELADECETCGHIFQSSWLSPRCPICDQVRLKKPT